MEEPTDDTNDLESILYSEENVGSDVEKGPIANSINRMLGDDVYPVRNAPPNLTPLHGQNFLHIHNYSTWGDSFPKTGTRETTWVPSRHTGPRAQTTPRNAASKISSSIPARGDTAIDPRNNRLMSSNDVPTRERPSTPFVAADHSNDGKKHLLLAASGSVATIKLPLIVNTLSRHGNKLSIRIIVTKSAQNFLTGQSAEQPVLESLKDTVDGIYTDEDEWEKPWVRGGGILHIELRRW